MLLLLQPQRSEERALDTSLGPDIAFALLVCGFLSFAEQRALLTVCLFSRHSIGPVLLSFSPTVSLESHGVPRGTGTSVLRVVAHDWRCDEESQPRCRESASLCITDPVMTQKGRRQQKEWKCGECQRWTWGGSKCWYCGSYGSMEQKGRILGDAANLESACKEDITATLRDYESLLKSMNAGAPAAAIDAVASRIEILKQAIFAKEPFYVQLVKVQAALTRAEEVAEKKHSAVWTAREAADKADQHVLNLRQRMAELTERIYTDTDTGTNEEPWSCGEWQDAGGSWFGWQWDQRDGEVQARAVGERTALGMEVENLRCAVLGLQQGQVDVQPGMLALIGELRGMAAAVAGLQQVAVPATPVARSQCKHSPGPMSNQLEPVTPRGTSKRAAEQSPEHPIAKCQQIEDSEDELIAGGEDVAQQQQMQRVFQSSG